MQIKKKLLATALCAGMMASAAPSIPAMAEANLDGVRYFSVDELLSAKADFDAEASIVCADATDEFRCKDDLIFAKMGEDTVYVGLYNLQSVNFTLTSVNPALNQIKILYNGQDYMAAMMGMSENSELDKIHIVWVDEAVTGDPSQNLGWLMYGHRYPSHLGESAREHSYRIIDENADGSMEPGWLPQNQEVTFTALEGDLRNNTSGHLYVHVETSTGNNMNSDPRYDDCLNSPEYVEGMECRLMFGENGMRKFFPVAVTTEENAPTTDEPDIPDDPVNPDTPDTPDGPDNPDDLNDLSNSDDIATPGSASDSSPAQDNQGPSASVSEPEQNSINNAPESSNQITDVAQNPEPVNFIISMSPAQETSRQSSQDAARAVLDPKTDTNTPPDETAAEMAENAATEESNSANQTSDYVEVPLAANRGRESNDFPWWIIVFIAAGVVMLAWWFVPIARRKHQKDEK